MMRMISTSLSVNVLDGWRAIDLSCLYQRINTLSRRIAYVRGAVNVFLR
jgi:hypothetical protein